MRRALLVVGGVAVALVVVVGSVLLLRSDAPGGRERVLPVGMMGGPVGSRPVAEPRYLAGMVAHHEEAVAAAEELQRSGRPEMRELGAAIVRTQSAQLDTMRQWLARWYPDRSPATSYHPMMRDLSGLSGDRLDEAFLRDMVPHHMVAVMWSRVLLARGAAHPEVERLAAAVVREQHAEAWQMTTWLRSWFGETVGPHGYALGPGRHRGWHGMGWPHTR